MRLLSISGLVPEQICDLVRFTGYTGERDISHYCGYASDFVSQVIHDKDIDGAVFPRSCDSSRVIKSYLSGCGKFLYQFSVPARQDAVAETYLAHVIEDYKKTLERHYHVSIDDIAGRTERINERNKRLGQLYRDIDSIPYSRYLGAIHEMLQRPLAEQVVPDLHGGKSGTGKRVFLVGSFLSAYKITDIIEDSGMTIVGDNLTESGRLVSMPAVDTDGDLYANIAKSILQNRLSPTQDDLADILERDMDEMDKKNVKGVIFIQQKYCEPYGYLYPVYKKMLDAKGISMLKLVLADSEDQGNAALAIGAFADMI